ncbi:TRAP transporter small permease [Aliishimia ponticola]|uniref:TRAP transporter small permease protein n=2 Tax=Aliishimia ponticola TaxID=2499833 RepID=A0A4S4NCP2_9RHOB|nr:TRAP transporter small permease [Aliishimia ponticola]
MPAFILDWNPPEGSDFDKLAAQFQRMDVTPGMAGLFGGFADLVDWAALAGIVATLAFGMMTVRRAPMEFESWRVIDRAAVFLGRVAMMLIVLLCCVMLYEVFVRYVLNEGTYWANEMSLWLAGYVFLLAGLYAMQQRSHIRIFLLYDICPRPVQRLFDMISTLLILTFAFFLFYGAYGEAFAKFYRWELFGTAFDPPIPATLKMMVLLVIPLVAIQAVINLISDWNAEPVFHTAADDFDEDELQRLRAAVGQDGVGELDVTRTAHQKGDN